MGFPLNLNKAIRYFLHHCIHSYTLLHRNYTTNCIFCTLILQAKLIEATLGFVGLTDMQIFWVAAAKTLEA